MQSSWEGHRKKCYGNSEHGAVVSIFWVERHGKMGRKGNLGRGTSISKDVEGQLRRPLFTLLSGPNTARILPLKGQQSPHWVPVCLPFHRGQDGVCTLVKRPLAVAHTGTWWLTGVPTIWDSLFSGRLVKSFLFFLFSFFWWKASYIAFCKKSCSWVGLCKWTYFFFLETIKALIT